MKTDEEKIVLGEEIKMSYPIITIYILGYKFNDISYMAVTVNRQVINSVNKETGLSEAAGFITYRQLLFMYCLAISVRTNFFRLSKHFAAGGKETPNTVRPVFNF